MRRTIAAARQLEPFYYQSIKSCDIYEDICYRVGLNVFGKEKKFSLVFRSQETDAALLMTDFKSFRMDGEVDFTGEHKGMLHFNGKGILTLGMVSGVAGGLLKGNENKQTTKILSLVEMDSTEFQIEGLGLSFDVPPFQEIAYPYLKCDLIAKPKCVICREDRIKTTMCVNHSEKGCAGDVGCNRFFD
jgi:hypothetical protein